MTPAARISAAIEVLDVILTGVAADFALTQWGRANRYAGSGDRAALRDLVFDALRCKRSYAALGGGPTGRGLMLGQVRSAGDPAAIFTGQGHAPAPVRADEAARPPSPNEALDCPDWLSPHLQASLGDDFAPVMHALQSRAPVFLRVNRAKGGRDAAMVLLQQDGIVTQPVPDLRDALQVTENARKIQTSAAYLTGLVELQDAASQAVIEALPLRPALRVLDYCAGGGGKTLAMASHGLRVAAHDANPHRMRDLPARAQRAGAQVTIVESIEISAQYDLILTDVPCSGSGSWRRDPQGKWALTAEKLAALLITQAGILDRVADLVAPGGILAYATCSLLRPENQDQIAAFLQRHSGWTQQISRSFSPLTGGDGFFLATLTRQ